MNWVISQSGLNKLITLSYANKLRTVMVTIAIVMVTAGSVLLLVANRYNDHLERMEKAYTVLVGYLNVSNYTYQNLHYVSTLAQLGSDHSNYQETKAMFTNNASFLDNQMLALRDEVESEIQYLSGKEIHDQLDQLDSLDAIEELVWSILALSREIITRLESDDITTAQAKLKELNGQDYATHFYRMIQNTINNEQQQVSAVETAVERLYRNIIIWLPISLLLLFILILLLVYLNTRKLTDSLSQLTDAVEAFSNGGLTHRVQTLPEHEFDKLGKAFNKMADQISAGQDAILKDNATLEEVVNNRTRDLEQSNQQLIKLNQYRSRFLADISHELRTPLTVIQGESEMALRGQEKAAPEYQEALSRVKEQAEHTTRLVNELLFIARSEAGHAQLRKAPILLHVLMTDVCKDFQTISTGKNINIIEEYLDKTCTVMGDIGRLKQVFTVLLDNAIRYSDNDNQVQASVFRRGTDIVISIEDFGIGLCKDDESQVFNRFYRANNASDKAPGSGLGLPVAKAIVDAHEGVIELKGKDEKGTIATVSLPCADVAK